MEWNEETIGRLQALWIEGHSTAEIGRRMGVSKNAVVGKAHRLNLSARPSPIRRDVSGLPARLPAPRRVTGPTLPPLVGQSAAEAAPSLPEPARAAEVAPGVEAPRADTVAAAAQPSSPQAPTPAAPERPAASAQAAAPMRPLAPPRPARTMSCCWPIGEPGTKAFRFCDADAAAGRPYCPEHASLAYVKVRDRREEAA